MPKVVKKQGKTIQGKAWAFASWGSEEAANSLEEIFSSTDRTAVIVGLALLDDLLQKIIYTFLIGETDEHDKEIEYIMEAKERIFDPLKNGVLSTLSSKIEMAFLLGLINYETRVILKDLAKLRNKFAHKHTLREFDDFIDKKDKKDLTEFKKHGDEFLISISGMHNPSDLYKDLHVRETYRSILPILLAQLEFATITARKNQRTELK